MSVWMKRESEKLLCHWDSNSDPSVVQPLASQILHTFKLNQQPLKANRNSEQVLLSRIISNVN
jgi:hypothetical protein